MNSTTTILHDGRLWRLVVYAGDCDSDGTCPVCCDTDFGDCACPGPSQEDRFDYKFFAGRHYASEIQA
jgi:hypothetical protein